MGVVNNLDVEKEKQEYEYCLRCGRKLKNPVAREIGYGAVCKKKVQREGIIGRLFEIRKHR